jgi:hypothetical protein
MSFILTQALFIDNAASYFISIVNLKERMAALKIKTVAVVR